LVQRDVIEGKVSPAAAREDYGVVFLVPDAGAGSLIIDAKATAALREKRKAECAGERRMIDRGPGFAKMLRGEVKPWTRSV
jgi:N-methylhydantoinase B